MSGASFQALFAYCPEMAFIGDPRGAILEWNEAMTRMLGPHIRERMPLSELVHPDDRTAFAAQWARLAGGPDPIRFECRIQTADGSYRSVSCSARKSPHRHEIYGMLSGASVTDPPRTRAGNAPAQNAGRSPLAVIECDRDLRVIQWSDAAEQMFGFSRDEALGQTIEALTLAFTASDEEYQRGLLETLASHRVCLARAKDGRRFPCAWLGLPVVDPHGQVSAVLFFAEDVSEDIALSAKRRQDSELLCHIERNLPIVVWLADRQGVLSRHAGLAIERIGIKSGEWVGKSVHDLYAQDNDGLQNLRRALGGELVHTSAEAHGMSWENWVFPIADEHGSITGAFGVSLDVTEMRRAERELSAKIALVQKQEEVIRHLGTPIIQIWDRVLALPLVGAIDSKRAAGLMSNVLAEIVRTGAQCAILDLTGVDGVDTTTAAHLVNLISAVRLLGTEGIITGIRPTVAQTMIALGLNLSEIVTLVNLREGLKLCMRRMKSAPRSPSQ